MHHAFEIFAASVIGGLLALILVLLKHNLTPVEFEAFFLGLLVGGIGLIIYKLFTGWE